MRKAIFTVLTAILALLCLASCSEVISDKFGTLQINIDTSASRGIQAVSMETASYNVVVKNSSDEVVLSSFRNTRTSYSISVPAGIYSATVEALNSAGDVIGTGSGSAAVVSGQTNSFSITVTESAGNGTFSIAITAEAGHEFSYVIKTAAGTTVKSGDLTYSEGVYSKSETLANGFYTFTITADSNRVIKHDSVRIIKDKTATYSAEFLFLNDGTVTIINEILQNPTIEITLGSVSLKTGDTLTASAQISGIVNYTCYWVIDGIPLGDAGAYADLEYEITDMADGTHEIALFASNGTMVWAESESFLVNSFPTSIEIEGPIEIFTVGNVLIPENTWVEMSIGGKDYDIEVGFDHWIENLVGNNVISVGDVSTDGYFAYLETEYDNANNRTIIYIVIDSLIENPAYLTLKFEHEYYFDNYSTKGPYLHLIENNDYAFDGMVLVTNSKADRTIKVEPGTYEYGSNYGSNSPGCFIDITPTDFTVAEGETVAITLTSRPYGYSYLTIPDTYDRYDLYQSGRRSRTVTAGQHWRCEGLVGGEYDVMLLPTGPGNITSYFRCYDTFVEGDNEFELVEEPISFTDTGLTVTGDDVTIEFAYNAVVPRYSVALLKVGDDVVYISAPFMADFCNSEDNAPISIALISKLEGYSITPTVDGEVITLTYDLVGDETNYVTLNIVCDDFVPDEEYAKSFPNLDKEGTSTRYEILVGETSLKILPGTYRGNGCWTLYGDAIAYAPRAWFTVSAGEEYTLHLTSTR